jgi:hypothetical protein
LVTITARFVAYMGDENARCAPAFLRNGAALLMKDYFASIEKLRMDAAEAGLIRDLATDPVKREIYSRLHDQLNQLADEVSRASGLSAATAPSRDCRQSIDFGPENRGH